MAVSSVYADNDYLVDLLTVGSSYAVRKNHNARCCNGRGYLSDNSVCEPKAGIRNERKRLSEIQAVTVSAIVSCAHRSDVPSMIYMPS
jgi:hypothetical protein